MRDEWTDYTGEVKGSKLNEAHISEVISLLSNYEVLSEITCIDMGLHLNYLIKKFKEEQAENIVGNLTSEHKTSLIYELYQVRDKILKTSNQLFVQSFVSTIMIRNLLENAMNY